MGFDQKEVEELLVACHRRCCICHKQCGVKMEIDHIEPRAESQDDSIGNAIPVCFECHAEIHLYNDKHPKGRKFHPNEIKMHKKQWLAICKDRPDIFIQPLQKSDEGPLYGLIDELKFNQEVRSNNNINTNGCYFETKQFGRLISEGYLFILWPDLAECLRKTYHKMKRANTSLDTLVHAKDQRYKGQAESKLVQDIAAVDTIDQCINLLNKYLSE